MAIRPGFIELLDRFDRNKDAYPSGQYNETQVRREFIDPFFDLLGWDVNNKQGYAQAYKDVIHEDAINIGGAAKAPDSCSRVGGTRKFFLEAKTPPSTSKTMSVPLTSFAVTRGPQNSPQYSNRL